MEGRHLISGTSSFSSVLFVLGGGGEIQQSSDVISGSALRNHFHLGLYGLAGIEPRSVMFKTSVLPTVLSLWSHLLYCLFGQVQFFPDFTYK